MRSKLKQAMAGWFTVATFSVLASGLMVVCPAHGQAASAPAQTRAQSLLGATNPKLAELTDKVLYGDVWARPGLSQRDRSLITVAALIAMDRPDQLRSHLARARTNGISEAELIEVITHMAFYSGWPTAVTATTVAKEVFEKK